MKKIELLKSKELIEPVIQITTNGWLVCNPYPNEDRRGFQNYFVRTTGEIKEFQSNPRLFRYNGNHAYVIPEECEKIEELKKEHLLYVSEREDNVIIQEIADSKLSRVFDKIYGDFSLLVFNEKSLIFTPFYFEDAVIGSELSRDGNTLLVLHRQSIRILDMT